MVLKVHAWIGLVVGLSLFSTSEARPAIFHPEGRDDISFTIAISNGTNSSQSEALLFQIQAPNTIQWVSLGQGDQMKGARIFLVYASSPTNVTVSSRAGTGHVPPEFDPTTPITLLSGTGIKDRILTARFACESCLDGQGGISNATDPTSKWIWAYKDGAPLNSDDVSAAIDFHDAFGGVIVDLGQARSIADRNGDPFANASSESVSLMDEAGSENYGLSTMAIAHGSLMAIAFVLLFPIFALLVPLSAIIPMPVMRVHAPLQGLALAIAIAGFGLGIKMWSAGGSSPAAHPIIGIVAVASLVLVQPSLGWLQHKHFKRTGGKSWFAYLHRWLGRGMIALGVIDGGLGFWWLGFSTRPLRIGMIIYAIVAGIVFGIYTAVHIYMSMAGTDRQQDVDSGGYQNRIPAEMRQHPSTDDEARLPDNIPRTGGHLMEVPPERSFKL